jgi:hypothetical protein
MARQANNQISREHKPLHNVCNGRRCRVVWHTQHENARTVRRNAAADIREIQVARDQYCAD